VSVYGSRDDLPVKEMLAPDPISPYGVAKLAAERYCVSFTRVYHAFETVVLRYFNVFGPRQSPYSQYAAVIPIFITALAEGRPVTVYGDGEQSRDFTYVENVVEATLRAAEADGVSGQIFNIATGSPASVNAVAGIIGRILDREVRTEHAAPRAGDIRDSWADVSAAREQLGFEPRVGLEEGLRATAESLGVV
jgi:nucleoside-diphosphate-sugar epimerase